MQLDASGVGAVELEEAAALRLRVQDLPEGGTLDRRLLVQVEARRPASSRQEVHGHSEVVPQACRRLPAGSPRPAFRPDRRRKNRRVSSCRLLSISYNRCVVFSPCRAAYKAPKKELPPFVPRPPAPKAPVAAPPVECVCPLCKDIMTDAAIVSCCGDSFCDECKCASCPQCVHLLVVLSLQASETACWRLRSTSAPCARRRASLRATASSATWLFAC